MADQNEVGMFNLFSSRELSVKFLMAANPHPNPNIVVQPLCHRAVIARYAD
jgi:hypothetical protein